MLPPNLPAKALRSPGHAKTLEQPGLTTYTQTIDGKDGKQTTRVRVGPFDSREEADKAAGRIRKLELSPVVLRI